EVADDQPVGRGAAASQRLGLRVGAVAELGGGGQYPAAGVVRHAGLPVQREAHRGHRDAGQPGYVPDPRRLPPSALLTRHGLAYGYDALLPPDRSGGTSLSAHPNHPVAPPARGAMRLSSCPLTDVRRPRAGNLPYVLASHHSDLSSQDWH